jgi:NADH:ubiquinone reductase (H+-translocating)
MFWLPIWSRSIPSKRRVTIAYGLNHGQKILSYDHLLLALGSETSFFNLPGVEESALTMKSLGDAVVLRNMALAMLEMASLVEDPVIRRTMLSFVVAGGGFAGVETVGALNDFVREAVTITQTSRKRTCLSCSFIPTP